MHEQEQRLRQQQQQQQQQQRPASALRMQLTYEATDGIITMNLEAA